MINYDALFFGFAVVMGLLFLMAWIGMSGDPHRTAGRPPEHPPGYRNSKRKPLK